MAFKTADRIKETSTTTGTGTLTLAGAVADFLAFSSVCANGDVCYYCADDGAGLWEIGLGTWGTGALLSRVAGSVIAGSSGAGVLVSFAANTKNVFITAPASKLLQIQSDLTIQEPVAATPVAPASGFLSRFVQSVAGKLFPAIWGNTGISTILQPHLGRNKAAWWQPLGNSATVPITTGLPAATTVGTLTARNVASTNIATMARRIGLVSSATAASLASWYFAAAMLFKANGSGLGGGHSIFRFVVSDAAAVSGARQFIGWSSSVAAPTNVEANTLTNSFGLAQLSTDATQWYMVYGGSAAQTAIALGTTIGAPTVTTNLWEVAFYDYPNAANNIGYTVTNLTSGVSVSGTLNGTAGTALPAALTALAPRAWRCNNATALAVGLDIAGYYQEQDY